MKTPSYDAVSRHCPICGIDTEFVAPPCPGDHDDCPESVCVDCGAAMIGVAQAPADSTAGGAGKSAAAA